jgi:hypothetical protein
VIIDHIAEPFQRERLESKQGASYPAVIEVVVSEIEC